MWKPQFCVSWLQEHFEEDANAEVSLKVVFSKYINAGGDVSKLALAKYIQSLFADVKSNKMWFPGDKKEATMYIGLKEKECIFEEQCYDFNVINQWVPMPFFVCKNDAENVEYGLFCDLVNGNRLMKKICFFPSGKWELYVGDTKINLEKFLIDNTFKNTRSSIHSICSIVSKLKTCQGKQKENLQVKPDKVIIEYIGEEKVEIYRSLTCARLIPLTAYSLTCRKCQNSIQTSAAETGGPSKRPKVQVPEQSVTSVPTSESIPDTDNVTLSSSNHQDMREILEKVLPEADGNMLDLLVNQKQNLARNPTARRWDKKTISLCLSLWCRSRKNYEQLRNSKVLLLPSGETLRLYKSVVNQQAGFNKDVFLWMQQEAKKYKPTDGNIYGGVCIDEMSIQEDLCMTQSNGEVRLVGFVDMGVEADHLNILCTGKKERPLATHVLQFLYIGLNGFRFPFACFPVTQTKAGNLHFLFWQAVKFLNIYEFKVTFVSMDGAQTNRDFMKMFFADSSPSAQKFSTKNIWSPDDPDIIFIMDYSHVIKRVRNNIIKSGEGKTYVRRLCFNQYIYWEHWVNAFRWDRETNAFPIHRKLTNDHLFLTQESKMRNKLAEDVMNGEMLNLMESFQKSLGVDSYILDDTISLLKATSVIVETFRDRRPIADIEDARLDNLLEALGWFNQWEEHVKGSDSLTATEKEKRLMSAQTREDLNSCIVGFDKLCRDTLKHDRHSIVPARVNSDVIEHIFCQQRGIINGNNTNPTFYQYVKSINSVIIGQNAMSKNSNAEHRGCEPLCFNVKKAIKPKKTAKDRKPLSTLNN